MKKVLVTGATGFIGNYVVTELLQRGMQVICTSANSEKAKTFSWFDKVTYRVFDIKQFNSDFDYYQYFQQPDTLIHLAWEGLPNYKAAFHTEENLPRHFNFLQNLILNGLDDVTVTGTCFEYGMQEGCLREDMPAMPANPYAAAKNSLREQLQAFSIQHPFQLKWLRLFYMYGKGQSANSLFSQLDKALEEGQAVFNMSGGEQVRDYLPVETMANYIVTVALQKKVTGIINCCSGVPVKIKDLVQQYLHQKHQSIPLNPGYYPYPDYEPMEFWGDAAKLKSIIQHE